MKSDPFFTVPITIIDFTIIVYHVAHTNATFRIPHYTGSLNCYFFFICHTLREK